MPQTCYGGRGESPLFPLFFRFFISVGRKEGNVFCSSESSSLPRVGRYGIHPFFHFVKTNRYASSNGFRIRRGISCSLIVNGESPSRSPITVRLEPRRGGFVVVSPADTMQFISLTHSGLVRGGGRALRSSLCTMTWKGEREGRKCH